ncbi:MAG: hypothetical protein JW723_07685 [Bacteroidales bacterium]|nr:hypothetical protein [Bacteroidales bacterium]
MMLLAGKINNEHPQAMNTGKLLPLIISLTLLSSCTHYYYAPNMHNVPLFQQKEEFHLDLSGSLGNEFTGFEVQAAFSLTDNIGIMANGFVVDRERDLYPDEYGRGHLIEGGAGAFVPLHTNIVFETYFGVGLGKVENGYDTGITSKLNLNRYFFQPSLGYTSDLIDIAVSLRLSGLRYNDIRLTGTLEQEDQDQIRCISKNPFSVLVEPAITLRGGWEHVKFQLQLGFSGNETNRDLLQEHINLNFGLYFIISDKYRNKKSYSAPE